MTKLTKERLQQLADENTICKVSWDERIAMARQLLATMEQEPYGYVHKGVYESEGSCGLSSDHEAHQDSLTHIPLYAAPQLPQPVQVDEDDNFYSWFGREWHENYQHNQYTTAAKQMLGVMAESAWRAGRSAAMLQGAEPVSQPYTLREGLAAIRNLGEIDAEKIQAERDALNEPTCWCHTCRPVTVADMRFVVCPSCGNKRCPHANDHRNACTGSNELGQEGSAYPAAK